MFFRHALAFERVGQQRRHPGQRQYQRAEQGKAQRQRHWREDFALYALKRENRHERQNDDRLGKQDRVAKLDRCVLQGLHTPGGGVVCRMGIVRAERQPYHQGLDQHHGAINDDAEVHCAERNQVGRHAARVHQDESKQQRQWNHRSDNQRSTPVAQENNQDRHHQCCADAEIFDYRVYGVVDEFGALIDRMDTHTRRQLRVQRGNFLLQFSDNLGSVLSFDHLYHAFNHVVASVERNNAGTRLRADGYRADVTHQYGFTVLGRHHYTRNVIHTAEQPLPAHHQRLVAPPQQPAADVSAVVGKRLAHVVERDAVFFQQIGVNIDLILLDQAAKTGDVGHPLDHAQAGADHPVLQRAHVGNRHAGRRVEHVAVNLAHRRGKRCQTGLNTRRQRDVLQFFQHLLARKVIIGVVSKRQRHYRQADHRHRTQLGDARDAAHFALDRQRHAALDFFRRQPGLLRHHLHLHVLHVGKGFYRQIVQRIPAQQGQRQRHQQHKNALLQCKCNQLIEHERSCYRVLPSSELSSSAPLVTTRSPARRPSTM